MSISLGGASRIPSGPEPESDLFCLADQQLYVAKQQGRNGFAWDSAHGACPENPL